MSGSAHEIADIISRFVGQMHIVLEEMRLRDAPQKGEHQATPESELALAQAAKAEAAAESVPIGAVESVNYALEDEDIQTPGPDPLTLPALSAMSVDVTLSMGRAADINLAQFSIHTGMVTLTGPMPTSVGAQIHQYNILYDQDIVIVGNPEFGIPAPLNVQAALADLMAMAQAPVGGLHSVDPVYSPHDVAEFTALTYQQTTAAPVSTASGPTLSGVWANGEKVETAPDLDDYLPVGVTLDPQAETPEATQDTNITIIVAQTDTSMTIISGGNLSVNEAAIVSAGISGTTLAVAGDYYTINVIVQINALSNIDTIDPALAGVFDISSGDDFAMNLASFVTLTQDGGTKAAKANPDVLPSNWQVTVVEGNLTFLNWLYQYNFTSDEDVLALTATGTNTTISSGENMGINSISFANIGMVYDLILIGGNFYDVNYISQINVLYDNDTISLMTALPNAGGSISTGGNLLWNEARIVNTGATDWTSGLPSHYVEAMDGLSAGNLAMPKGFSSDAGFTGIAAPKVLYVTGNVFDINYIEQINVMGDADQVLLYAEAAYTKTVDWAVSTGGNVLINAAAIIDQDGLGTTAYLGGSHYSEALLIQSEILLTNGASPTAIINEAVAFIAEDFGIDTDDMGMAGGGFPIPDYAPLPLDSMLA